MQFRTIINNKPLPYKIDYDKVLFFMGSCFSEHIGNRFLERKFKVLMNPFGNIYNPLSLFENVCRIIDPQKVKPEEIHFFNNQYFSFFHHTLLSNTDKEKYVKKLNDSIFNTHEWIKRTDFLILTLGTSWVYEHLNSRNIVANCHKIPANSFNKRLLSVKEVTSAFSEMFQQLKRRNPKIRILFTISPVKHINDTIEGNSISKSILRVAAQEIVDYYEDCYYYPAYEIVNDDLRDYRFYHKDLVHPNEQAIDYIWQHFLENGVSDQAKKLMLKVEKIINASNHKPFNVNSESHQKFIKKTLLEINELELDFPGKFEAEKTKLIQS